MATRTICVTLLIFVTTSVLCPVYGIDPTLTCEPPELPSDPSLASLDDALYLASCYLHCIELVGGIYVDYFLSFRFP